MNIVIVEPDALLARMYRQVLEAEGHVVATATTAQAAVHAADERRPNLVLLEMQLVSHSGVEFLYEFRSYSDWQDIPVIILSVVPKDEFAGSWDLLTKELGVVDYHYKPQMTLAGLQRLVRTTTVPAATA